jgi:hypothetical protein
MYLSKYCDLALISFMLLSDLYAVSINGLINNDYAIKHYKNYYNQYNQKQDEITYNQKRSFDNGEYTGCQLNIQCNGLNYFIILNL